MSKYGKYLMMAAMMAMMGQNQHEDRRDSEPDHQPKNDGLKCFREGCERKRHGNKLYCSAECCKLDKKKKTKA